MESGIFSQSIASIRYYLSPSQKIRAVWMFVLVLISSFMDVVGLVSLIPVMMVAAEPGGVQRSKVFGPIYQVLNFDSERNFLFLLIVAVFVFFLLKNAFSVWINHLQLRFTADVGLRIIELQLQKYLHIPYWYFNDIGSANIVNSTLTIPSMFVGGVMRPLFNFLSEVAVVAVIVISILFYKPILLGILALLLVPSTLLMYRFLRSRSQELGNRMHKLRPISFSILNDLFSGYVELKLANKQVQYRDRLLESQAEIQKLDAMSALYAAAPVKGIEMVAILGVLTIFLYAILFPSLSTNLITLIGLFAAAAYRLMPSVNRMLTSIVQIKQNQYSIEDLALFREAKFSEPLHPQQLPLQFNHTLRFDNLVFTFPGGGKPALHNISLDIKKGEKIGFIGSSGSGKTTLMNVLLRFYTEQQGRILIDGEPLTSQHQQAWHQLIGYVKQDTFLMDGSIQDNITLGDAHVDAKRLRYAIEQASLTSFIDSLPEGVETLIGEKGSKLSGGQRQRIGIARAMYKKIEILVLDEATSALDNETEREVSEAISKLSSSEITILIIAHRVTTLRDCNRIYELSQGQVVAEHQYEELVQQII